jgi:RNA polymerase sigma-70 factor (ECF subfamily)
MSVESISVVDEERMAAARVEPDRLDPSAFGQLYERHRVAVFRYLRARTRNDEDAMDLASLTFERAFAGLGRFRRRDGGVLAWLLRIARNSAIDAHRRGRPTVDLAGAGTHLGRAALEADRLGGETENILDLVHRLPGDLGDTLMLRYAAGLTAREIGVVIGKREGAVQKQIERGLAALREEYA